MHIWWPHFHPEKDDLTEHSNIFGTVPLGRANSEQNFGLRWSTFHHNQLFSCTLWLQVSTPCFCALSSDLINTHKVSMLWYLQEWNLQSECLGLNCSAISWLCDLNKLLTCPKPQHLNLEMKIKIVLFHDIGNNRSMRLGNEHSAGQIVKALLMLIIVRN